MSKISLEGNVSGSGTLTIAAPNTNSNFTLTLPTETGTIITNSGNQAGSFTTLNTSGAVVFNDAGANVDFRVEGDTEANLLFVDASADAVGIGTSSPGSAGRLVVFGGGFTQLATTALPATSGSTRSDFTRILDSAGSRSLDSSISSTGAWIQSRDKNDYSVNYDLFLQPNGGNVGIGTSSPSFASGGGLNIFNSSAARLALKSNATGANDGLQIGIDLGGTAFIEQRQNGPLLFATNSTERMRIDNSGTLLAGVTTSLATSTHSFQALGTTSGNYAAAFQQNATGQNGRLLRWILPNTNDNDSYFVFATNISGTNCLNILGNGNITNSNNSYGGISDVKLKENIVDTSPKLDKIAQVRVVSYNLKSNPEQKLLGVVAQELEQIFPGMVSETQDYITVTKTREVEAVFDDEGNEITPATTEEYTEQEATGTTTKSVKYSVFVPMLIKAIQEQQAIITSQTAALQELKAELDSAKEANAALEARITAIENGA
jgi:hypothetical protein